MNLRGVQSLHQMLLWKDQQLKLYELTQHDLPAVTAPPGGQDRKLTGHSDDGSKPATKTHLAKSSSDRVSSLAAAAIENRPALDSHPSAPSISDIQNQQLTKRPYLRKGAGMRRYRMSPSTVLRLKRSETGSSDLSVKRNANNMVSKQRDAAHCRVVLHSKPRGNGPSTKRVGSNLSRSTAPSATCHGSDLPRTAPLTATRHDSDLPRSAPPTATRHGSDLPRSTPPTATRHGSDFPRTAPPSATRDNSPRCAVDVGVSGSGPSASIRLSDIDDCATGRNDLGIDLISSGLSNLMTGAERQTVLPWKPGGTENAAALPTGEVVKSGGVSSGCVTQPAFRPGPGVDLDRQSERMKPADHHCQIPSPDPASDGVGCSSPLVPHQQHDPASNVEVTPRRKRERRELEAFEKLERAAADSSFCSTSSFITNILHATSSTPQRPGHAAFADRAEPVSSQSHAIDETITEKNGDIAETTLSDRAEIHPVQCDSMDAIPSTVGSLSERNATLNADMTLLNEWLARGYVTELLPPPNSVKTHPSVSGLNRPVQFNTKNSSETRVEKRSPSDLRREIRLATGPELDNSNGFLPMEPGFSLSPVSTHRDDPSPEEEVDDRGMSQPLPCSSNFTSPLTKYRQLLKEMHAGLDSTASAPEDVTPINDTGGERVSCTDASKSSVISGVEVVDVSVTPSACTSGNSNGSSGKRSVRFNERLNHVHEITVDSVCDDRDFSSGELSALPLPASLLPPEATLMDSDDVTDLHEPFPEYSDSSFPSNTGEDGCESSSNFQPSNNTGSNEPILSSSGRGRGSAVTSDVAAEKWMERRGGRAESLAYHVLPLNSVTKQSHPQTGLSFSSPTDPESKPAAAGPFCFDSERYSVGARDRQVAALGCEVETFRRENSLLQQLRRELLDGKLELERERQRVREQEERLRQTWRTRFCQQRRRLEAARKQLNADQTRLREQRRSLVEPQINTLKAKVAELTSELARRDSSWSADSARLRCRVNRLQTENQTLSRQLAECQRQLNTASAISAVHPRSANLTSRSHQSVQSTNGQNKRSGVVCTDSSRLSRHRSAPSLSGSSHSTLDSVPSTPADSSRGIRRVKVAVKTGNTDIGSASRETTGCRTSQSGDREQSTHSQPRVCIIRESGPSCLESDMITKYPPPILSSDRSPPNPPSRNLTEAVPLSYDDENGRDLNNNVLTGDQRQSSSNGDSCKIIESHHTTSGQSRAVSMPPAVSEDAPAHLRTDSKSTTPRSECAVSKGLSRILSTDQDSAQKQPSTTSISSLPYTSGNSAASQHAHATATPPHYCDVPPDSVQRRGVSATSPRCRDVPPDSIQRGDVSATSPHYRDLPPDSVQRRDVLLDGTRRVNYINGDWKETSVNGDVLYYYAIDGTRHSSYSNGSQLLEFSTGQIERRDPSGIIETRYPCGSIITVYPSGEEQTVYSDGTRQRVLTDGTVEIMTPEGKLEVHTPQYKKLVRSDGTVKFIYPDGRQETRYPGGRVRIRDGRGQLVVDTQPPPAN